jgi:hypothetical protein
MALYPHGDCILAAEPVRPRVKVKTPLVHDSPPGLGRTTFGTGGNYHFYVTINHSFESTDLFAHSWPLTPANRRNALASQVLLETNCIAWFVDLTFTHPCVWYLGEPAVETRGRNCRHTLICLLLTADERADVHSRPLALRGTRLLSAGSITLRFRLGSSENMTSCILVDK